MRNEEARILLTWFRARPANQRQAVKSLLSARYRAATIGTVGLFSLIAFEALAVTTVMPLVVEDLDGEKWFSAAFSTTLAASVVGMVAGGAWCDQRGPRLPLLVSVSTFTTGVALAGLAPDMGVFVVARFLQGLGGGAMLVSMYVLVARLYDEADHPRIFGAFAAGWVVPALVGPTAAGLVAAAVGWRWVFLIVFALAIPAMAMLAPAVRRLGPQREATGHVGVRPMMLAVVVASSVVVLDVVGERASLVRLTFAGAALVAVLAATRGLLPAGTLVARRGLPATIVLRGVVAAVFVATEVYLPLMLQAQHGVEAWASGLVLSVGAVLWFVASWVQSRVTVRLRHRRALGLGTSLLLAGVVGELVCAALQAPLWAVALFWGLAGTGMGLMFPRISTLVLSYSGLGDTGNHMAALAVADAVGSATVLAIGGLLFAAVASKGAQPSFVSVLGFTSLLALLAVLVSTRAVVVATHR